MESNVDQIWTEVLDRASEHIDVSSLRVWFEGIRPVDLYDDRLEISVPNTFAKEYIESRFRPLLGARPERFARRERRRSWEPGG